MGMSGRFDGLKPSGFKTAAWANSGGEVDKETGNRIDGICVSCNQWDAELKDGFCRDDACKDKRQALAISQGKAIKIIDGLPGGTKILHSKGGKQLIK